MSCRLFVDFPPFARPPDPDRENTVAKKNPKNVDRYKDSVVTVRGVNCGVDDISDGNKMLWVGNAVKAAGASDPQAMMTIDENGADFTAEPRTWKFVMDDLIVGHAGQSGKSAHPKAARTIRGQRSHHPVRKPVFYR